MAQQPTNGRELTKERKKRKRLQTSTYNANVEDYKKYNKNVEDYKKYNKNVEDITNKYKNVENDINRGKLTICAFFIRTEKLLIKIPHLMTELSICLTILHLPLQDG